MTHNEILFRNLLDSLGDPVMEIIFLLPELLHWILLSALDRDNIRISHYFPALACFEVSTLTH